MKKHILIPLMLLACVIFSCSVFAASSDIEEKYKGMLQQSPGILDYCVYDIDEDGTPELFMEKSNGTGYYFEVYTMKNNRQFHAGTINSAGHGYNYLCAYPNNDAVLDHYISNGYEIVDRYYLDSNKKIKSQRIYKMSIYDIPQQFYLASAAREETYRTPLNLDVGSDGQFWYSDMPETYFSPMAYPLNRNGIYSYTALDEAFHYVPPVPPTPTPDKFKVGKVTYTILDNGDVEYTKLSNKNAKTVTIPETVTYKGRVYQVGSIGPQAFKKRTKLTKVNIGNNVETIGRQAFAMCTNLKTVNMGSRVEDIGDQSFYKCTNLRKLTIPYSVERIGKQAFYQTKKMKRCTIRPVDLDDGDIGTGAFSKSYSYMTVYVPESVYVKYEDLLSDAGLSRFAYVTAIDD